jgi:hypothetical protein
MILANHPDARPEHCLLSAYVLGMEAKFDAALNELARGITLKPGATDNRELYYLGALFHRKLYSADQARLWIERALALDDGDPRYLLEHSRTLWMINQFATAGGARAARMDELETAISDVQRAGVSKHLEGLGREFKAQLHNALAFFNIERGLITRNWEDIRTAEKHLARMAELVTEHKWTSKFDDTAAWVNYARAQYAASPQIKLDVLNVALIWIKRAIEKEKMVGGRQRLLMLHEDRIQEAMREVKGPG